MCLAIVNFACRMLVGAIGGGGGFGEKEST